MYNERKEMFTLKNIILIVLGVLLLIVIGIILFPKGTNDTKKVEINNEASLKFDENVMKVKNATEKYLETSELPAQIGDIKEVTVKELIDSKIIYILNDSNSSACDYEKSKVTITNLGEEYEMNVSLTCPDYSNYKKSTFENINEVASTEEETDTEQKEEIKEEQKEETKEEPKEEVKEEPKTEPKEEVKEEPKTEPKEEVKEEPKPAVDPFKITSNEDLINKAHKIYGSNNGSITRGEFASSLVIIYEDMNGEITNLKNPFSDTTEVNIIKAATVKIVSGNGNGLFKPDSIITREEAAVMTTNLISLLNYDKTVTNNHIISYTDYNEISSWATPHVNNVVGLSIMSGVSTTSKVFDPKGSVKKAHLDLILQRTYIILK